MKELFTWLQTLPSDLQLFGDFRIQCVSAASSGKYLTTTLIIRIRLADVYFTRYIRSIFRLNECGRDHVGALNHSLIASARCLIMIHRENGIVGSLTVRIIVSVDPPSWLDFIDLRSEVSVLSSTHDHTKKCICHK